VVGALEPERGVAQRLVGVGGAPQRQINGFEPYAATITADGPTDSPHRYCDGSLCVWYPRDDVERKWVGGDGLNELIAHVAIHLFKEAYWRETGEWLGPEAPHDDAKHRDEPESPR
jgi:hypothetical protein